MLKELQLKRVLMNHDFKIKWERYLFMNIDLVIQHTMELLDS